MRPGLHLAKSLKSSVWNFRHRSAMIHVETISTHDHVIRSLQQRICVKRLICWGLLPCSSMMRLISTILACLFSTLLTLTGRIALGTLQALAHHLLSPQALSFQRLRRIDFQIHVGQTSRTTECFSYLGFLRSFAGLPARWQVGDHSL